MEDRQKIIAKLVKIKALAERGIGGEQQTAQVMYTTLKEKYKVTDAEIEKAAAVPVDISEIDLKKFWGIAFQLAAVAKTLQEETDICTACPYTYTDEQCTGCGTYWNMRDLRLDFEAIQQNFNYCSKCGQLLDLDEWKRKEEPPEAAEELKFDD